VARDSLSVADLARRLAANGMDAAERARIYAELSAAERAAVARAANQLDAEPVAVAPALPVTDAERQAERQHEARRRELLNRDAARREAAEPAIRRARRRSERRLRWGRAAWALEARVRRRPPCPRAGHQARERRPACARRSTRTASGSRGDPAPGDGPGEARPPRTARYLFGCLAADERGEASR
jgi:hypothetical protein